MPYKTYYVNHEVDNGHGCAISAAMAEAKKPFPVRLDDWHLEIVDDLRRLERDIPTRGGMIRILIERAGDARKQKDKRK